MRLFFAIFVLLLSNAALASRDMPEGFNERLRVSIYTSSWNITELSTELGFPKNKISKVLFGEERLPLFSVIHAAFILRTNPVWLLLGHGERSLNLVVQENLWSEPEFESIWTRTVGGRLKFLVEKNHANPQEIASHLGLRTSQALTKTFSGHRALNAYSFVKAVQLLKGEPYDLLGLDLFAPEAKHFFKCEPLLSQATDQELVDVLISRGWKVQLSR